MFRSGAIIRPMLAVLCLALLGPATARANLELTFDEERTTTKPNDPAPAKKEKRTLVVTLGRTYFANDVETHRTIYDFTKRRIYHVDTAAKVYTDDSLFTDLGFRVYEFQNRLFLGGAFAAVQMKNNPVPQGLMEHLFSLRAPDSDTKLQRTADQGEVVFAWQGQELLAYREQYAKASPEVVREFVRFLRYRVGGHPDILAELQKNQGIPVTLRITRYNVEKEVVSWDLTAQKTTPDTAYDLADLKPLPAGNKALAPLLARVGPEPREAAQKQAAALVEAAKQAFDKGTYLDAMLAYLEYTTATGAPMPAQFQGHRERLNQDPDVRALMTALSPHSKEEAEKAVESLRKMQARVGTSQPMLCIYEANFLTKLGDRATAMSLFIKALDKNPYIAGAWKDLGGLYLEDYDVVPAWQCRDAARRIAPQHGLLKSVNEFEAKLVQDHPEFF